MNSRKAFIFLGVLVVLVAIVAFGSTKPAAAGPATCMLAGGSWEQDGDRGWCYFTPDHWWSQLFCSAGEGAVDHWLWDDTYHLWLLARVTCQPFDKWGAENMVTSGVPVDVSAGRCGATIFNPPYDGSVTLSRYARFQWDPGDPNFRGAVCEVNYYDSFGDRLLYWGSPGYVFYNLDNVTLKMWENEELAFWIYDKGTGTWSSCLEPKWLPLPGSDFGRVACYASNPTMFGIGPK